MKLVCEECGRANTGAAAGWQFHLVDLDDDGVEEVIVYCPDCGEREFGALHTIAERQLSGTL